jgi:hypothetical protein
MLFIKSPATLVLNLGSCVSFFSHTMAAITPTQFYFSNECGQHHDAPPTNFVPEPASSHRGAWDASSRRMYDTVFAPDDYITAWATFPASRQR